MLVVSGSPVPDAQTRPDPAALAPTTVSVTYTATASSPLATSAIDRSIQPPPTSFPAAVNGVVLLLASTAARPALDRVSRTRLGATGYTSGRWIAKSVRS